MVKDIATVTDKLPAFLKKADGPVAGNENVGAGDIAPPYIKLIQQLSPELNPSSANYIEGAKAGQIVNTVTRNVVDGLNLVNVFYKREYAVYTKREAGGGGFHGACDSQEEGWALVQEVNGSPDTHTVRETGKHLVLLLDDKGDPTMEALMLMDGSKIATSNQWNTAIATTKVDRFASVWNVSTVAQSNSKGSWFNYSINFVGYTDESLYAAAKTIYERVAIPQAKAA